MGIPDIMDFQKKFDDRHGWHCPADASEETKLQHLQHNTIAMTGEFGEFANVVKKVLRHRDAGVPDAELWAAMREELIDVFIYFIKLADLLGVDIETEYFAKMAKNDKRFVAFEKK